MTRQVDLLIAETEAAHLIHSVLDAEPTFLFNHVLVQETAYNSILVKRRREYHLLVAAAFEQAYAPNVDEYASPLAFHYMRGEDWSKAARYARIAADRAMRVYGLREAIDYYTQALQALDRVPDAPPEVMCDVILGWADAAYAFEPYPKQFEQLARAERLARAAGDKRRLAMVLHAIGKVHIASGHPFRGTEPFIECLSLATELDDERLSMIPMFYMGAATYDLDPHQALSWFRRAIDLAHRFDDADYEALAWSAMAFVQARLGDVAETRQDLDRAFELVPRIKSPMSDSDVHLYSAWAFLDLGDVPQALAYAKKGVQKALSADNMECACFAFACLGFGHLRAEQVDEAMRAFEEAVRRSKISGAEPPQILGEMGLGVTQLLSGHPEGIEQIERALAHAQSIADPFISALLAQTLGEFYLQQGKLDLAVARLDLALEYFRRHRLRPYLVRALDLYAQVLERRGEAMQASQARAEIAGLA